MDAYERIAALEPDRNPPFIAVDRLRTPRKIKEFYKSYVQHLQVDFDKPHSEGEARKLANKNIGYILGYYDRNTANVWMKALHQVMHPVFGRIIPFSS